METMDTPTPTEVMSPATGPEAEVAVRGVGRFFHFMTGPHLNPGLSEHFGHAEHHNDPKATLEPYNSAETILQVV